MPAETPTVTVTRIEMPEGEDWYTPNVKKPPSLLPQLVTVTLGKTGTGRVRCSIGENCWERTSVELKISYEEAPIPDDDHVLTGEHSTFTDDVGNGSAATLTPTMLDRLIRALEVARSEAAKRGLLNWRTPPATLDELVAAAASVQRVQLDELGVSAGVSSRRRRAQRSRK